MNRYGRSHLRDNPWIYRMPLRARGCSLIAFAPRERSAASAHLRFSFIIFRDSRRAPRSCRDRMARPHLKDVVVTLSVSVRTALALAAACIAFAAASKDGTGKVSV